MLESWRCFFWVLVWKRSLYLGILQRTHSLELWFMDCRDFGCRPSRYCCLGDYRSWSFSFYHLLNEVDHGSSIWGDLKVGLLDIYGERSLRNNVLCMFNGGELSSTRPEGISPAVQVLKFPILGINKTTENRTTHTTEPFRRERGDSTKKTSSGDPTNWSFPSTRG